MTGPNSRSRRGFARKRWLQAALAIVATAMSLPAFAKGAHPMRFDRISMSDGLSQSTVNVIHQDSTGFLWLGTENGLNRYDGNEFHHYKREPGVRNALANDFIRDLSEDPAGNVWVATKDGGLARWNAANDDFTVYRHDPGNPHSIASDSVRAVLGMPDGSVWVGTRDAGLDRLDPATGMFTHYRHKPNDSSSLGHDKVKALLRDSRGTIWVGTDDGLSRFDPISHTFTTYRHDPDNPQSLSDNMIRALFEDRNGALWVGTLNAGVNVFDGGTGAFRRYASDASDPFSLSDNRVYAIVEDDAGRLWIGTGNGLNLFDIYEQRFFRYQNDRSDPGSLSDSYVRSLYQDRSGVLYVGTRSSGLNKWNPRSWGFGHTAPDQLSLGNVTSFAEDASETLWVGTFGGGVNRIDRATGDVEHFAAEPDDETKLADDRIMSLLMDSENSLWLGTMFGGLNRMDVDTGLVKRFTHDPDNVNTLSAPGIMSLYEDRRGNLWVGTFNGGVNLLEKGSEVIRRFPFNTGDHTGLSGARATAFAEDAFGRIWIGTDGNGLNVLDPETGNFFRFHNDLSDRTTLSADTVYALHVDIKGTIWVGTGGGGLDQVVGDSRDLETIQFRNLSQDHAEASNHVVYGIESDTQGHLWLSTNYGLIHYVPTTGVIRNFHRSHGLQDEEFNFGAHFRSARGELFFGGANGFNAFFPTDLQVNQLPPQVILTSVSLLNQPVETGVPHWRIDGLDLDYQDDVISFKFSALDYTAPAENRYAYMLEGFDPKWIEAGSIRNVTYTNLEGGRYVFRVKAANSDGTWQEQGVSLSLNVNPPPWKTWWAYIGYALGMFMVMAVVWRAQQKKLLREAEYRRRLEQDVQARTKELAERNDELRNLNQRFLEASLTDPLTGLHNRRYVFEEVVKNIEQVRRENLAAARGEGQPNQPDLVFMMIDLDNFKPVNDTCGHTAGDRLLLQVRDLLLDSCRQTDEVIRWGGDEFLVIGRYADPADGEALAERIRERMSNTVFSIGNGQVARTTASIGVVGYPFLRAHPDMLEWEQLLNLADAAMYRAKSYRDAWVAYISTELSYRVDNPFYSFRDHTEDMIEQGLLRIHTSHTTEASHEAFA